MPPIITIITSSRHNYYVVCSQYLSHLIYITSLSLSVSSCIASHRIRIREDESCNRRTLNNNRYICTKIRFYYIIVIILIVITFFLLRPQRRKRRRRRRRRSESLFLFHHQQQIQTIQTIQRNTNTHAHTKYTTCTNPEPKTC